MKRIFSFFAVSAAILVAASSLTGCKETQGIVWNIEAQASGEGKITIEYPTGNPGLVIEGAAVATASTANDVTANGFMLPANRMFAAEVLENPTDYTKQEVMDAEKLVSEAESAVKFHVEGEWEASVTGYAKYGSMYFVIDEHWPVTPEPAE